MEQNMEDLQYCEIREWLIKKAKHYQNGLNYDEDPEDTAHEVLLEFFLHLGKYDEKRGSMFTYLTLCLRRRLWKKRRARIAIPQEDISNLGIAFDCGFDSVENLDLIKKVMERLTESERQLALLEFYYEEPIEITAEILDITCSAAYTRIFRLKKKMKKIAAEMETLDFAQTRGEKIK